MRAPVLPSAVVFTLAVALISRADPGDGKPKPKPLTSKELSGIWRGEKDGMTIEVIFRRPEFRGTKDDADCGIRNKNGSIFATLKRVDHKKSGSVHLRFDSIAKPTGTVIGYLEWDDRDELKITVLPVAKEIVEQYETVTGFPLRKVKEMKLFAK